MHIGFSGSDPGSLSSGNRYQVFVPLLLDANASTKDEVGYLAEFGPVMPPMRADLLNLSWWVCHMLPQELHQMSAEEGWLSTNLLVLKQSSPGKPAYVQARWVLSHVVYILGHGSINDKHVRPFDAWLNASNIEAPKALFSTVGSE